MKLTKQYQDRLNYELELIEKKSFIDYFLIVADIVAWAKERMLVGPGRGSAAGSLVCYLLGITEVDPIKHGLLFERFIDLNRDDLPDIDVDFPPAERANIIEYIREKYGEDHTAQLITFSTFQPKGVIQDGARVLGIPPWETKEATAQLIERAGGDEDAEFCLRDSIKQHDKLKKLFKDHPGLKDAIPLEGQTRQTSIHAAAVILSGRPLGEVGSISRDGALGINKKLLEEYGLLKIDILGLENLSIIQDICHEVGFDYNDFYNLPLDDELTFEKVFTPGKLLGIFQFEGFAVGKTSKAIRPTTFEHLAHITSLGRPGPLNSGITDEYIKRFHGKEYERIPELHVWTKETLGCIIFQEQVMNVVKHIGGFSWKDTGAIRKAMSKSQGEAALNVYREKFIEGALANGLSDAKARYVWDQIYTHGAYGFNLSHAVSYAVISYWTAYCKAHWPGEFYARALRSACQRAKTTEEETTKVRQYLKEWGGPFVGFDINESSTFWTHHDGILYGGYTNIKGIGDKAAPKIVAGQPYENDEDARSRIPKGMMSKIDNIMAEGQPWADLRGLEERVAMALDEINLGGKGLLGLWELKERTGRSLVTLGRVTETSLRDHNAPDKIAKRGNKMDSPTEYVIFKLIDEETENIYTLFVDRYVTEKSKDELLGLTGKICLLKVEKREEGDSLLSLVKFKVLEEV